MQPEKLAEVVELYRTLFRRMGIEEIECSDKDIAMSREVSLAHCHGMLDKILAFIRMGRIEKAHRWIGFIQGVLWAHGIYSLDVLKEHNTSS